MNGNTAYLDTSAVVKLLINEPESTVLRRDLRTWSAYASSALLSVELIRTIKRAGQPGLLATARKLLASIHLIRLDDALLQHAADLEPTTLRSLDSIHLATALTLGNDLGSLITYDRRFADSALACGLPVLSPADQPG